LYSNVPLERVLSMHDSDSVYAIPELLHQADVDTGVINILRIGERVDESRAHRSRQLWSGYIQRYRAERREVAIGITGKYTTVRDSYASIIQALEHAGTAAEAKVRIEWIDTSDITEENVGRRLAHLQGIIVPGGFGLRGAEGKIHCIRQAREERIPYLGLCYGFQLAVIEYARHVCGLARANTTEIAPDTPHPVIDLLPEQKQIEGLGGSMRLGGQDVAVAPDTLAARLFQQAPEVRLRFRHRYEVNPAYGGRLEQAGLVFSGRTPDASIMQVLELPAERHPYFIATQAHTELTSRPMQPDAMFLGLVRAAMMCVGLPLVDDQPAASRPECAEPQNCGG
jgi:CTP synthase